MKLLINKPNEVDVKFLKVFGGDRLAYYINEITFIKDREEVKFANVREIFERFPSLQDPTMPGEIALIIDVETGRVINWPTGYWCEFIDFKIVDEGTYILSDTSGDIVAYYDGYVPNCLNPEGEGYGDYWEFVINSDGHIQNWMFCQKDLDELLNLQE